MELQQVQSDWSQYFCSQPSVEFGRSANQHFFRSELKNNDVKLDPHRCVRPDSEGFKSCSSRSFAMDARIRLDQLKSGSTLPLLSVDETMYNSSNSQKEMQDRESQDVQSALDLVELLEVEDDVEDEESWLYESPKKQVSVDTESALTWCRQVLDNPSPEMEAACRRLINKLDQSHSHSSRLYRCPAVFHQTDEATADSSVYKTSANTIHSTTNSFDKDELNVSHDSITSSYRLQDITDVHIMARIQEDSLRQDYVSPRRSPDSQLPFASSRPLAKQSCQSPKLARLHQQVTQFKLLKLAQNQGTPAGRTRSPLQTSLRSLQAIRNSRSLETDDCHAADQITHPATGVSPARLGSSWGSPSLPAASLSSKGSSVQMPTKNLQRSHSLSPCRIPHSAKGFLSVHKRVFAAPERQTTVAWGRFVPSHRR